MAEDVRPVGWGPFDAANMNGGFMTKNVSITIGSAIVAKALICPYNSTQGLDATLKYEVPLYKIAVGGSLFAAIRFGVVRKDMTPPRKHLICDCGIANAYSVKPSWKPEYSPHSFAGSRPGAWVVFPNKTFYIHEGPGAGDIGGTLGCIEICGTREWDRFLNTIEAAGGADCATLAKLRLVTVVIEAASWPTAVLV